MTRIAALAAALVLALPAAASAAPINSTVVGGGNASLADWPFIAALVVHGQSATGGQFCGGSVLDARHVVTAAHCVEGESAGGVDVVVGRSKLGSDGGQRVRVAQISVHPKYRPEADAYDIAMLRLADPVSAPAIVPARSTDSGLTNSGDRVRVAGWGLIAQDPSETPAVLQEARLTVFSSSLCKGAWGDAFSATLMVCAGGTSAGLPDSCNGDSGGPLVADGPAGARLVGLVSYGSELCGDPDAPGVYTRVSAHGDFIASQLGGAPPPDIPPSKLSPRVSIGRISCKTKCSIDVGASGTGAADVPGVIVRIRRKATSRRPDVDRSYLATRLTATRWRLKVKLPSGKLRISARAVNESFKTIGTPDVVRILMDN